MCLSMYLQSSSVYCVKFKNFLKYYYLKCTIYCFLMLFVRIYVYEFTSLDDCIQKIAQYFLASSFSYTNIFLDLLVPIAFPHVNLTSCFGRYHAIVMILNYYKLLSYYPVMRTNACIFIFVPFQDECMMCCR